MTATESTDAFAAPAWAIRPEQPIDIDQINELHLAAFHGSTEAELVDAIRVSAGFLPELSLVAATADGSVLGHVLVSRVGFEPDAEGIGRLDVLALAPLAVLPAHEGRGIGTALMRAVLALADLREEPFVVVVGSPAFYERFGFEPAAAWGVTGPYDRVGDAFRVRARGGSGEVDPGRVVYPPAFGGA